MLDFTQQILSNLGAKILAIGDIDGYIYNPNGLNMKYLDDIKNNKSILEYKLRST